MLRSAGPAPLARDGAVDAIADRAVARGGFCEHITKAAAILVLAREVESLLSAGPEPVVDAIDPSIAMVADIVRQWNPALITAREYAEMLPPVMLDRLLRAAPIWAERVAAPARRRAA